jgi:hypothetical protein
VINQLIKSTAQIKLFSGLFYSLHERKQFAGITGFRQEFRHEVRARNVFEIFSQLLDQAQMA